jgi:CBS domain-containing protein
LNLDKLREVHMTAARILKQKPPGVTTIGSEATIADAVELLAKHNIGALVVSDGKKMIAGIISERDIVRGLGERGSALLRCLVRDCMTSKVITCSPSSATRNLLSRMTELRLRHLPVVDDNAQLVGMVSIGDVVKLRLDNLATEVEALHGYITSG